MPLYTRHKQLLLLYRYMTPPDLVYRRCEVDLLFRSILFIRCFKLKLFSIILQQKLPSHRLNVLRYTVILEDAFCGVAAALCISSFQNHMQHPPNGLHSQQLFPLTAESSVCVWRRISTI